MTRESLEYICISTGSFVGTALNGSPHVCQDQSTNASSVCWRPTAVLQSTMYQHPLGTCTRLTRQSMFLTLMISGFASPFSETLYWIESASGNLWKWGIGEITARTTGSRNGVQTSAESASACSRLASTTINCSAEPYDVTSPTALCALEWTHRSFWEEYC